MKHTPDGRPERVENDEQLRAQFERRLLIEKAGNIRILAAYRRLRGLPHVRFAPSRAPA